MKTAEEIISKHANINPSGVVACHKDCILLAMEEYAEQARREERERHRPFIEMARLGYTTYSDYEADDKAFKKALFDAGYKEEDWCI